MDQKYKYLKYKSKYSQLKKQTGGENNNNILLESQTKKFAESLKDVTPIYKLDPTGARNALNKMQEDRSYLSMVDTEDFTISSETVSVPITIFRPKNNKNILKAAMFFHGGGWVMGNKQTHGRLISEIVIGANIAIVFIDYTLAPDAQFPTQINQCYLATQYISTNAGAHNLDASKLIVMGDSVGGGMATAIALISTQNDGPKIYRQMLFYPVIDATMKTESYKKYKNGPWLSKMSMEWFFDAYAPDKNVRSNILISPLNATPEQLKNLPDGLVIVDENDVLRDEGKEYAHKLMDSGVVVIAVEYLGTHHDFLMLDSLKDTPVSINARNLIINYIINALQ